MTQVESAQEPEKRKPVATLLSLLELRTVRNFAAKNNRIKTLSASIRYFMEHGGFADAVRQQHAEETAMRDDTT